MTAFDDHFRSSALAAHGHERRGGGALSTRMIRLDSPAHESTDPATADLVVGLMLGGSAGARWGWDGTLHNRTRSRRVGALGLSPIGAPGRFEVDGPSRMLIVVLPFAALADRLEADRPIPRDFGRLHDVYGDHPRARALCRRLWRVAGRDDFGRDLMIDALAEDLLAALACAVEAPLKPPSTAALSPSELARVVARAEGGQADVQAMADAAAMPVRTFRRRFAATVGQSPHRWLTAQRIARARRLLRDQDMPLGALAMDLGFASQAHFTEAFTRATGASPGRYRRTKGVQTDG